MKKLYLISLLFVSLKGGAETHTVQVSSNQFSPANLNVVVGDVITWEWSNGVHNTTSLAIPAGATAWFSPTLSAPGHSFSYTVTVAGAYNYECYFHSGFMTGSFTASATVPVTLSNFNVRVQNNRPRLSWTTQQESNSDYFGVRRSYDGALFTEIGRVPAAVNSSGVKNYFFIDADVRPNVKYIYYELAITDKDGSMQLSPIMLFRNNERNTKLITSISPNPVSEAGHLMIQFNADGIGKMVAVVTDINGRQVLKNELQANTGVNNGHIHLGGLPGGNYVVQFSLHGLKESYKIRKK